MARLRYLADTNILSDLIRNPSGSAARHAIRAGEGAMATSIVVACELRFGATKRQSLVLSQRVDELLKSIDVMPLDTGVDERYAEIRWALEQMGTPIGLDLTLVSDNEREFSRVPELRVTNWLAH
jgi:tRNA(fMet)-specific endonuclease VapC